MLLASIGRGQAQAATAKCAREDGSSRKCDGVAQLEKTIFNDGRLGQSFLGHLCSAVVSP